MKVQQHLNGVDVERMMQTIEAVKGDPSLARFRFRARNEWMDGAHNRTTIGGFYGAGEEDTSRTKPFVFDADEPPVLLGENRGANPVEFVLKSLAGCLMTSLVYHASARGVQFDEIQAELEGDLDLRGFLGLDENVRNGYENIRVNFKIKSDAPEETLREMCEIAQRRSPTFDMLTNPVNVTVSMVKS